MQNIYLCNGVDKLLTHLGKSSYRPLEGGGGAFLAPVEGSVEEGGAFLAVEFATAKLEGLSATML